MRGLGSFVTCTLAALSCLSIVYCRKYRICIVDGRGGYKKSGRYCPALDHPDSKVECVVALDRLDCLRRLSKGTADFSVFSAEDLVTAQNSEIEILITNELRYSANDSYEYEVVAIVNRNAGINSRHDLKGKRYCHPGYGYETDWTRILANYFEASVVTPSCDPRLTITENRIKATADFFRSSCKAGPWVYNTTMDIELKKKYRHLCQICGNPAKCSMHDEYWGRRGSLLCLTDGAGDVSWARLDDVEPHFGLKSGSVPNSYNFLCPDDTLMPLNATKPCVWVVKPWPVVAASRVVAQDVQEIVSPLTLADVGWKGSLLKLMQTSFTTIKKLDSVEPIESYLHRATGYLSANSFSGCHPPRTINICTTSIIENAKCAWMRESAAVYGLEPDIECIKADNTTHCMLALNQKAADVVMVPPDLLHVAKRDYNLTTLFYEITKTDEKYITVAVTRPDTKITSFEDLRGKKACFPVYDGVAWNTAKTVLFKKQLIEKCTLDEEMANFFGPSCTPGIPEKLPESLKTICRGDTLNGEFGALQCLASGIGDVAFVSRNSIRKFVSAPDNTLTLQDFEIFCESKAEPCHLSWASIGQGMIRGNTPDLWKRDTMDVFLQLDNLFGKNFPSLTNPFMLFGKYDGKSNLLFHDATLRLRSVTSENIDTMPYQYKDILHTDVKCIKSQAPRTSIVNCLVLFLVATSIKFCLN